jgi:hypothetical protein
VDDGKWKESTLAQNALCVEEKSGLTKSNCLPPQRLSSENLERLHKISPFGDISPFPISLTLDFAAS